MFSRRAIIKLTCVMMVAAVNVVHALDAPISGSTGALGASATPQKLTKPWVVYYDSKLPSQVFNNFDLLVFDPQHHPQLQPLLDRGKTLIGYLNAGEVEERERFFSAVQKEGIVLHENGRWKKSYYIDLRDKRWAKRVIEELIPRILHKGFQGIFLDTLDNPIELERTDPEKYKGMAQAAVNLVKAIRYHYPTLPIIVNRAFEILPQIGDIVTMVLGESMYTAYDMEKKQYKLNNPDYYKSELESLKAFKKQFPKVRILSLEYTEAGDKEKIKEIYKLQRENGFEPYVSVIGLDQVIEEPK